MESFLEMCFVGSLRGNGILLGLFGSQIGCLLHFKGGSCDRLEYKEYIFQDMEKWKTEKQNTGCLGELKA